MPFEFRLSAVEMAKSISPLQGLANSRKEFDAIKATLVPGDQLGRINQILSGLEQEDEFAIFCKVMGTCESISRLDQSPIIKSSEKGADFLASFRPGIASKGLDRDAVGVTVNCFVEVKSCSKKRFKITKNDLNSRKAYAARFGLPLIVAVRFLLFGQQTLWVLMEAGALERQGRHIDCTDLTHSLTQVLFDDYGLYTHPALNVIHYYDTSSDVPGIRHHEYGALTKTVVVLPNEELFEIPEDMTLFVSILLQSYEQEVTQVERSDNLTVTVSYYGGQMRLLSDIVYSSNYLAKTEDGEMAYDPRRTIARLDSERSAALINREMMEHAALLLNSREVVMFKIGIGNSDHQEKVLKSFKKNSAKHV